ncbi:glycosyltransferase family 2 protein [Paenibacillus sp. NPDC057934]|uniref:glycosyltransferase family 2 protein n=1 Tax=Paenibacillus sp. NPDC057934 TaxID=3346282 RepID=UPI0036DD1579
MDLSIVIPTRDKWPRLRLTLLSLENVVADYSFEVIIVDDGSEEEIQNKILHYAMSCPYTIRIVRNNTPLGRSGARNKGITISKADRILFLDDDCLVSPLIVSEHAGLKVSEIGHGYIFNIPYIKFFEDPVQGFYYAQYAKTRQHDGLKQFLLTDELISTRFDEIVEKNKKMNSLELLALSVFNSPDCESLRWVGCAGANLSIPMSICHEIQFDLEYGVRWGAEDLDLGIRLIEAGHSIRLLKNAGVYHMDHPRENYVEDVEYSFSLLKGKFPYRPEIDLVRQFLLKEITIESLLLLNKQNS